MAAFVGKKDDVLFYNWLIYRGDENDVLTVAKEGKHGIAFNLKGDGAAGGEVGRYLGKEYVVGKCLHVSGAKWWYRIILQHQHQANTPDANKGQP